MKKILVALGLSVLSFSASALDEKTKRVIECMRNNVPEQLRVQHIELTATDTAGGTRVLSGKLYGMRQMPKGANRSVLRANLRIDAPSSLAGASYLIREAASGGPDGMYVYLPSVQRVKRITGSFADGSLLGTNFSYNDLKQMETAFISSTITLEESARLNERDTQVLSFKVPATPGGSYSRIRSWIDTQSCLPLQTEFYEGAKVRKKLSASPTSIRAAGKHWYIEEAEMVDLQDGSRTVLRILKVETEMPLPEMLFSKDSFYKVPVAPVR